MKYVTGANVLESYAILECSRLRPLPISAMEHVTPEQVENLWDRFDEHSPIVYESTHQEYTAHEYITGIVEDMAGGLSIQDSDDFWDLLDYLGLDYSDFPWEEFREWYDSIAG